MNRIKKFVSDFKMIVKAMKYVDDAKPEFNRTRFEKFMDSTMNWGFLLVPIIIAVIVHALHVVENHEIVWLVLSLMIGIGSLLFFTKR